MLRVHVLHPGLLVVEMAITFPAVNLVVVLLLPVRGLVRGGIFYVLLKGTVMRKPSRTAITIRHQMVVVRSEERDG
jgi:hypothetical protein